MRHLIGGLWIVGLFACGARSTLEEDAGAAPGGGTGATGGGAAGGAGGVGGAPPTVGGYGGFGGEGGVGGVVDPVCPPPDATFCTEPQPCYLGPSEVAGKGSCTLGERLCQQILRPGLSRPEPFSHASVRNCRSKEVDRLRFKVVFGPRTAS